MKNDRLTALNILNQCLAQKIPLTHLFKTDLSAFTKELCFGVCRHFYSLNSIASKLVTKKPKSAEVWLIILIGIYQLHYLNKADYAVVNEAVELLKKIKKTWAKGLVNGVLRNFCRKKQQLLHNINNDIEAKHEHPLWLIEKIKQAWPNNWENILAANNKHAPMSLRVNQLKLTRDQYLEKLKASNISAQIIPNCAHGLILDAAIPVAELPGFSQGEVSLQDGAAQLAVSLLNLKPNLRVLDACAAPGGKYCYILESEPNLSTCIALDVEPKRINKIQENLQRLKLQGQLLEGDARQPKIWWDGIKFDRILLDAPCSATGVIRRHADIKILRKSDEIMAVVKLQRELLEALWPLLAADGLLVYATCSILPEENEEQIKSFCKKHSNCTVEDKLLQILPGENNMDGFFYSVLRKPRPL